jgi:hypothetical protein
VDLGTSSSCCASSARTRQSHYLPAGWESRVSSYGHFGALDVFLVDTHDIAASRLMSPRTKDRDDLRALVAHLDKKTFAMRLQTSCAALLNEPDVRKNAELNYLPISPRS